MQIAFLVTLIVLLILAGVSIALLTGENGIIKQATQAKENSKEAEAREKLELILLNAYNEKNLNGEYNENEFLDEMITKEIKGAEIKGEIAIVDGYAYELDRSVPKIGRYLGKEKDLIFPEIDVIVKLSEDSKTAAITIAAQEETNGINKIEIWQAGEKLEEFEYDNVKEEITQEYISKQNGKYTIKVYADIMNSKTVEVEGIVAEVKFEPEGNNEWKKEHSTKVIIEEVEDKVINAKYQWTNSVIEPEEDIFTESFKSGDTITKNEITGTHYLWTMIETQSGKKVKWRSEGFNFDNEGPIVTLTSTPVSESSFTLNVTANDANSGIERYEFYVENNLKETIEIEGNTAAYMVRNMSMGTYNCFVIVTDKLGNQTKVITKETARTKQYTWEQWNCSSEKTWDLVSTGEREVIWNPNAGAGYYFSSYKLDSSTGVITLTGGTRFDMYRSAGSGIGKYDIDSSNLVTNPSDRVVNLLQKVKSINKSKCVMGSNGRYYNTVCYVIETYKATTRTSWIKGQNKIKEIRSNSRNYKEDGKRNSDGYWYVYIGIK
ncbi:MAG: hypothetical protein HFJ55_00110 [Clostridia bacterium]|nr:hypothetical protein [Clostridia bacterium]